jgi:hypothetical protein
MNYTSSGPEETAGRTGQDRLEAEREKRGDQPAGGKIA